MRHPIKEIFKILKASNGDCIKTSKELGIHKSTVYRWKKRLNMCGELPINRVKRKSTRPHTVKYILTQEEKRLIIQVREKRGLHCRKNQIHAQTKGELPYHPSLFEAS